MSAPLRFLAIAVIGWGVFRAASLDMLPIAEMFTTTPSAAAVPPIMPTVFPPIEPPVMAGYAAPPFYPQQPYGYPQAAYGYGPPRYAYAPQPYAYPVRYHAPASYPASRSQTAQPVTVVERVAAPDLYAAPSPTDHDWLLTRFARASVPARRSSAPVFAAAAPARPRLDRLQFTSWALLRSRGDPSGLATGGTLGGSQAGARLTYNFDRRFAASIRTSAPVGTSRGGEVAAGLKVTPFPSIPVSLTAERRQSIGRGGGRSAFALFVEGGVYRRPMPWKFELDAYAQAGVVGVRHRDLFADGGFTFTRPLFGRYSAGFGMWGGVQPGLYRVDAGPRISMKLRDNIRLHLDWRQRIAGTASPPSGPALTLASDF